MALNSWFDAEQRTASWFDSELDPEGWWDRDLLNGELFIQTVADATTAIDGLLLDLLLQPIIFDASTITDASTTLLPILLVNINQESTLVMIDVPTVNWRITPNVNDATTVSEQSTVLLPVLLTTVSDATAVTEFSLVYWPITINQNEATGISDFILVVMFPLSPILVVIGDDVPISELTTVLLPILNCEVNEVIITDDAAPPTIQIGGHGREYGPALVTDVDAIT